MVESLIVIGVIFAISAVLRIQENGSIDRTPFDYDQTPRGKQDQLWYRQKRYNFRLIVLLLVAMGAAVIFGNP